MLAHALAQELDDREARALRRRLPDAVPAPGPVVVGADGRERVNLQANDYLGLAGHPAVAEGAIAAIREAGCSATGSRLLSGNLGLHERLEARLAGFKGTEAALLFNAGYAANLGVLSALAGPGDLVVGDKLNHASLIDGARASGAEVRHAPHGRVDRVAALLDRPGFRRRLVAVDAVFSMDGDVAPVAELLDVCRRFEATLVLDEAHATGVLGATGRGTLEHLAIAPAPDVVQVGTLSKALGGFGAFVATTATTRDWLLNAARPLIYSTALPPAVLGAALSALDVLASEPQRLERLRANARRLREGLRALGLVVPEGVTPIIPVAIGDAAETVTFARDLHEAGVVAQAVRPPTVPPGTARLRVTASASHTPEHLDAALEAFEVVARTRRAGPQHRTIAEGEHAGCNVSTP